MSRVVAVMKAINRRADVPLMMRPPLLPAPKTAVYCVYRATNGPALAEALDLGGGPAEVQAVHLWALDEVDPGLGDLTRDAGPGPKFALINELLRTHPPEQGGYVAVLDDDFAWHRGNLARAVALMATGGLDLAQPTHDIASHINYGFTISRPRTRARLTNFVEIGPAFVMSPRAQDVLLPFPKQAGMGWGLETVWMHQCADRFRMAQLDEVTLLHRVPAGSSYSMDEARAGQRALHASAGLSTSDHPQRTFQRWAAVRRTPPWRSRPK